MKVDIKDLDKAEVLAALYAAAPAPTDSLLTIMFKGLGYGFDVEDAQDYINEYGLDFDYIQGRPIKVNLEGDSFDARLFDRDAGAGAAEKAVKRLRKK